MPPGFLARRSEGEPGAEGSNRDVLQARLGAAVEFVPAELAVEVDAVAIDPLHRRDAVGGALCTLAADVVALRIVDAETRDAAVSGEVSVDGAAFGGHVRPANQTAPPLTRDQRPVRR